MHDRDNPRELLAKLLFERHWEWRCDELFEDQDEDRKDVWRAEADLVFETLGLTQQYLHDSTISDGEPRPWEIPYETRYVTEWKRH